MESIFKVVPIVVAVGLMAQGCWVIDRGAREVANIFGRYVVVEDPNSEETGFDVALETEPGSYIILVENSSSVHFDSTKIIVRYADALGEVKYSLVTILNNNGRSSSQRVEDITEGQYSLLLKKCSNCREVVFGRQ